VVLFPGTVILYEHPASGNCLKARVMLDQVGADYERVVVDLFAGETRTPEHFARNPDGRVPVLELDSGEFLPESNAILLHLAEGTEYLPSDPVGRAHAYAWMMFEQNQVDANLGVARFLAMSGRAESVPEVFADRQRRAHDALATLERALAGREFLVGDAYTVADLSLYGYVHAAADARDRPLW
jgi:glutathione S-transferase